MLIVFLGVFALMAGQLSYRWIRGADAATVTKLDALSFSDVDGQPRRLTDWPSRVLVVNFWATWCPPCKEEMPEFTRLQTEFGGKGVQFVGIAIDERKDVKAFLERFPVNYPILIGESRGIEWAAELGNTMQVLPFTAVLDRTGRVLKTRAGVFGREQLLEVLNSLEQPGV